MKLSVGPRRVAEVGGPPNPWARAGKDWAHVQIVHRRLASPHHRGETRWLAGEPVAVVLNTCLSQRERRCTLAHELEHLERGQPCGTLRSYIEARVVRATSLYLLPDLEHVADTLGAYDAHTAAAELWVTFPVLIDRLNNLTDTEADYVYSKREEVA